MGYKTRIFIDFWNFQINWNKRTNKANCDWNKLPVTLLSETSKILTSIGANQSIDFEEVRVYASIDVENPNDKKLRKWLNDFLDMQPSFNVNIRERTVKSKEMYCKNCKNEFELLCPNCNQPIRISREKGVDAAIVTDLFSLAWEEAYNLGILLSSDSDFVPAVKRLQEKGIKIVNAKWKGYGFGLAKACWAAFDLDNIAHLIC